MAETEPSKELPPNPNWKLGTSAAFGITSGLVLLVVAWLITPDETARALNFAIIVVAASIGWLAGIFASPYDKVEEKQFLTYAKAISLLVTGYFVGKIDRAVEALFATATLSDPLQAFRVISFFAIGIITMIVTFVFRQYAP